MRFETTLAPDENAVSRLLGYGDAKPDGALRRRLQKAAAEIGGAAAPRWVWRAFPLAGGQPEGAALFSGGDVAAHLDGCREAVLLAVTLGREADDAIRAAGAFDVAHSVLLDNAASALAEQYADEAERILRREALARDMYLTGRFSPGYGDFPLDAQAEILRLLDAHRAIGLGCGGGGLLLPGKSVTAVLGAAGRPVQGRRTGCENCSMAGRCRAEAR